MLGLRMINLYLPFGTASKLLFCRNSVVPVTRYYRCEDGNLVAGFSPTTAFGTTGKQSLEKHLVVKLKGLITKRSTADCRNMTSTQQSWHFLESTTQS